MTPRPAALLLAVALLAVAAAAAEIPVRRVDAEPAGDPRDRSWLTLPAVELRLLPQTSVPPATLPAAGHVDDRLRVRAQRGPTRLALHLEWRDPRPAKTHGIGRFADAAAVQWPLAAIAPEPAAEPPYLGMGHRGAPVEIWFWRADGKRERLAAAGFGTLTTQPGDLRARAEWQRGRWRVVIAAAADPARATLPVAFAVWSGEDGERDGLKRVTAWQTLRLDSPMTEAAVGNDKLVAEAATADAPASRPPAGDAARGARLMQDKGCAGCHAYPGNPGEPATGPDLRQAGALHTGAYLAESLAEPSRIIVPGRGYFVETEGRRASIMPPFDGSRAERDDLVAFLRSLR